MEDDLARILTSDGRIKASSSRCAKLFSSSLDLILVHLVLVPFLVLFSSSAFLAGGGELTFLLSSPPLPSSPLLASPPLPYPSGHQL
eukprot:766761-Hanusia_phi.AAC.3